MLLLSIMLLTPVWSQVSAQQILSYNKAYQKKLLILEPENTGDLSYTYSKTNRRKASGPSQL